MTDRVTYNPHGKHLIAGDWLTGETTFDNEPARGPAHAFAVGTPDLVDRACKAAEEAFWSYGYSSREDRAAFLNAIADEIEARAEQITEIGSRETGLPEGRLQGERGRTTGQLRIFAEHILKGDYLDRRHDEAQPDRQPLPRPDLKMVQRPIGPVAVFGASNFPLAFSPPVAIAPRRWLRAARSLSRATAPIPALARSSQKRFMQQSASAGFILASSA